MTTAETKRQRDTVRPTDLRRRSRLVQAVAFSHSVSTTSTLRRMMTVTTYFIAWVLVTLLVPVWLPIMGLVGLFRKRSFIALRLSLFLWSYLTIELMGLTVAAAIYLVTPGNIAKRQELFFPLYCWWGTALFSAIARVLSLSVEVKGQELVLPGHVLVFIRHASIIDTALPLVFLSDAKGLRLRYVFKRELLVDPCIDVAGHVWPNYFIDRGGDPQEELAGVRKLAEDLGDEGVLLYPEGTRFTERKKAIAIERLARTHPDLVPIAESFKHCLPPKPGGALTLMDAAPEADILFVAHRGLEGLAEINDLLSGDVVGKKVQIQIWRVPAAEIPKGEERRQWLFEWWKRIDDFVDEA
ncbi:MAG: 1-acyl-sn-glycerol-3-phosphate acyltransferase [Myxococcales bacterium]|nr:1-acyl-sn-glycerol-3-phosphate acyltransferase [Myxococcales bacterium]